jgi:hypothetical protein
MLHKSVRRVLSVIALVIGMLAPAVVPTAVPAGAVPPSDWTVFPDGKPFDVSEHGTVVGFNDYYYRDLRTGAEFSVGTGFSVVKGDGRYVVQTFDRDHGSPGGVRIEWTDRSTRPPTVKSLSLSDRFPVAQIGDLVEQISASSNGELVAINTRDANHHWLTVWNTRTGSLTRIGESLPRTAQNWGEAGARISADGSTLVFLHLNFNTGCTAFSLRTCSFAVYVANADGSGVELVTADSAGNPSPVVGYGALAVSGNGQVVAYIEGELSTGLSVVRLKDRATGESLRRDGLALPWNFPSPYDLLYLDNTGNRVAYITSYWSGFFPLPFARPIVWDRSERRQYEPWRPDSATSYMTFTVKSFAMSNDGRTVVWAGYDDHAFADKSHVVRLPVSAGSPNVEAGQTVEVAVAGAAGIPTDADTAVLNVTAVGADASGYLSVWPCGQPQPTASSVNYAARQDTPNLVVSKVGTGGRVCVFSSRNVNLVVDVSGYIPAGSELVSINPVRKLDTRTIARPSGGATIELQATGGSVPVGSESIVVNLTATQTADDGFVTSWPCGQRQPTTSSLNFTAGSDRANMVLAKLGDDGKLCLFTSAPAHIIADVAGYSPAGMSFTPLDPRRLLDTRAASPVSAGRVVEVSAPAGAKAVALTVTATRPKAPGYATVWPCGEAQPEASSLNYRTGGSVANGVISQVGSTGKVCIFSDKEADFIVDLNGMFPSNSTYVSMSPVRIYDSRVAL